MGTLKRFGKVFVVMRAGDHPPEHVHVKTPDGEVQVELSPLAVVGEAKAVRAAGEALRWIAGNVPELLRTWEDMNR